MRLRRFGYPALFAAACSVLTSGVHAQDLCQEPAGRFASIDGEVDVQRGSVYWRTAQLDQFLCEGDTIRVGDRSRVAIQLINNAVLRIDQNTSIRLVNISSKTDERSWLDLVSGALQSFSRQPWLLRVTATLGLSFDALSGDGDVDKDQVNPKFGITWSPFAGTTLRGAAFRALKRTLITDQTLEPTQVAGFNQFFDDFDLTEAWRYGGAIDQKFTKSLFGGLEFSKRDLTVPNLLDLSDPFNPVNRDGDWDEYLGHAYLFWTPHPWLALRAQYLFERFERDLIGPTELDTQRVPLGIGFFHPSGLSASFTATHWDQDGTFTEFLDDPPTRSGSDEFWTVDAAISYRLPKRYGFISVGATNLFDEEFKFFEVDIDNPTIQPTRMVFARVTLAFP